jgi:hypothetical protein
MNRLRRQRGHRNIEPLPVLFLYRHAIELYLKAIIIAGNRIKSGTPEALSDDSLFRALSDNGHRLLPLLPRVEAVFSYVG